MKLTNYLITALLLACIPCAHAESADQGVDQGKAVQGKRTPSKHHMQKKEGQKPEESTGQSQVREKREPQQKKIVRPEPPIRR